MPLEIKPYIGIGEVEFGMTENEIISIMGEPTEKEDNHWDFTNPHIVLIYDFINVHFKIDAANTLQNIIVKNRKQKKKDEIIFLEEPLYISAKAPLMDYFYKYQKQNFDCVLVERSGQLSLPEYGITFNAGQIMENSLNKRPEPVFIYNINYPVDKFLAYFRKRCRPRYGDDFTLADYRKLSQEYKLKSIMLADEY